jgi:hypothetical protein
MGGGRRLGNICGKVTGPASLPDLTGQSSAMSLRFIPIRMSYSTKRGHPATLHDRGNDALPQTKARGYRIAAVAGNDNTKAGQLYQRPNGGNMRGIKRALRSAFIIFAAVPGLMVLAQSNGVAQNLTRPLAGGRAPARMLAPADIIIDVRRAGFEPISRPVLRGPVYVLVALDESDIDVKLTVDARSGRVLWLSDVIGARYGGYYAYPAWPRYGRPPAPPADIPDTGPGRNNFRPERTTASVPRSLPLPRTRPADLTSTLTTQSPASTSPSASGAGKGGGSAPPAAQSRSDAAAAAKSPPIAPTMVPVAPLE